MLFRTTEQVGDPELLYNGYVGFGVMPQLGARLAMFDRHGCKKERCIAPPPVLPQLHRGILLVVFHANTSQAHGLPSCG